MRKESWTMIIKTPKYICKISDFRSFGVRFVYHLVAECCDKSANRPDFLPTNRLGGVLVLLYERDGAVRVLLTTRSKLLRSHPGQHTITSQLEAPGVP